MKSDTDRDAWDMFAIGGWVGVATLDLTTHVSTDLVGLVVVLAAAAVGLVGGVDFVVRNKLRRIAR